jgi:hypothetical protein
MPDFEIDADEFEKTLIACFYFAKTIRFVSISFSSTYKEY